MKRDRDSGEPHKKEYSGFLGHLRWEYNNVVRDPTARWSAIGIIVGIGAGMTLDHPAAVPVFVAGGFLLGLATGLYERMVRSSFSRNP